MKHRVHRQCSAASIRQHSCKTYFSWKCLFYTYHGRTVRKNNASELFDMFADNRFSARRSDRLMNNHDFIPTVCTPCASRSIEFRHFEVVV